MRILIEEKDVVFCLNLIFAARGGFDTIESLENALAVHKRVFAAVQIANAPKGDNVTELPTP